MNKLLVILLALLVGVDATQHNRNINELPTVIEADRKMMSRLEICYQKFKPEALLSNHRPGKWITQIWQKDRIFGNLSRNSILLRLPTVPVVDALEPGEVKSYIIYKEPGNWGPLTIIIKPQRSQSPFPKVHVALLLNDTVDLSDAVKVTTYNRHQVYSYTTFCAPPGQYRILLQAKREQELLHVELVHKYEQMHGNWTYLDQVKRVKIRCRSRKQNKQMLIKWDKSNVDGNQMQYCLVINHERNIKNFCEAIAQKMTNESFSCKKFDFLHEGFSTSKQAASRVGVARRLDLNGTSIFCTGTKSQQIFRRFKPNMNYFIDVFGVHPNLSQLTFHLGSHRMWHSTKNFTIGLAEGRTGHGKLSQLSDMITFSYKPFNPNTKEITLYIVPCGGTVMLRILRQKRLLVELRHIHKPTLHKINMTLFHLESSRLIIKVLPNSVDEALSNIKVELTATSINTSKQMRAFPKNLSVSYLPSVDPCNSVDIFWHSVPRRCPRNCRDPLMDIFWHSVPSSRVIRYCVLSMVASTSSYENIGLCGVDEKILKHTRFHQLHCLPTTDTSFDQSAPAAMERMRLVDLSPKSSYIVYITATLSVNPMETIKYEPLRVQPERFCNFYQDEEEEQELVGDDGEASHIGQKVNGTSAKKKSSLYDFNRLV